MDNPIKLVAENPDLKVKPLNETEMNDLIKVLDFLWHNADIIREEKLGKEPPNGCEAYDMARDDLNSYFIDADILKRRLQEINMPCIAKEIHTELKSRFSELDDDEMRRALRTVLNKYYKG